MKFLSFFKRKPKAVAHEIVPIQAAPSMVKLGKWVFHLPTSQPGILGPGALFPQLSITLVNPEGENYREIVCHASEVRTAALAEIPEKRRPSPEVGASLGYF
jgi:hypothetical protein